MKATVVVNPIAGPGRTRTIGACVDLVKSVLARHQYDADVRITTGPNDAHRFATEAAAGNCDLVVAWGGDGTVNGAAAAVAGTGIPLAIVPGGSGNGLARDLSLPFDPTGALTVAATGKVRAIDAGDLHGSLFFNVAGIGLDAHIAGRLATKGHRRGLMGYVLATISELRSYEACAYSISKVCDAEGRAGRWDDGSGDRIADVERADRAAVAGVFRRPPAGGTRDRDAFGIVDGDCLQPSDCVSRGRGTTNRPESHGHADPPGRPERKGKCLILGRFRRLPEKLLPRIYACDVRG